MDFSGKMGSGAKAPVAEGPSLIRVAALYRFTPFADRAA
jgi:hypothetical protein